MRTSCDEVRHPAGRTCSTLHLIRQPVVSGLENAHPGSPAAFRSHAAVWQLIVNFALDLSIRASDGGLNAGNFGDGMEDGAPCMRMASEDIKAVLPSLALQYPIQGNNIP